ncbi:uncharacterized protein E0L32_005068 [Thyridium curvatum]|uniref:Cytochrome c oxidase assembly factor 6 n=1 Tax=Thyridium curvatum TaxID=1093900 RepID=A0A507B4B3_9PEZI|nr:uncharacterized protein E0L32_005068 [Thyridium curvatum]TPX14673.1 hypothetical protein E0L32_005068 [Thyridium curvatum]
MGLFSFTQSADQKRAEEVRTGAVAPSRSERAKCWESRDKYFACLDRANIIDALKDDKEAARACKAETADFERDCATQWYRVANHQKEQRLKQLQAEGARAMSIETGPQK